MSSEAKIAANQSNSKSSTGAVTEAGKQIVSGNSVKHGLSASGKHAILPSERAQFEAFLDEYLAHFRPVGPEERDLVISLAQNTWRIRRAHEMEAALFEQAIREKEDGIDPATAQAQAWNDASKGIQRISLYASRIQRTIDKAGAKLDALQSARKAAFAKAQEEAILLAKLARAKGNSFDPASHLPPDGDFGGFAFSDHDLAQAILRKSRLEEARARFAPAPPAPELTMRDLEALIG
jgi:hypothetical protein